MTKRDEGDSASALGAHPGRSWRFGGTVALLALAGLMLRERNELSRVFSSLDLRARVFGARPTVPSASDDPVGGVTDVGHCPAEMALVEAEGVHVCVDRWEGTLVEIIDGAERPFSPFLTAEGHQVKAVSKPGVTPQGYISRDEAEQACVRAGKRLCEAIEWKTACAGPNAATYPYGPTLDESACNIQGRSPLGELFGNYGDSVWDFRLMNDPSLNALEGTVARTASFVRCTNAFGVFDMVGNLHEWTADKSGVFRGGYYLDAEKNGSGCSYATSAHPATYHDYSTGFRCCKDPSD